jgi:DNA replication protein DnaC
MSRFDPEAFIASMAEAEATRRAREAAKRGISVEDLDAVLAAEEAESERKREVERAEERARFAKERREDLIERYGARVHPRVARLFIDDALDQNFAALIATKRWLTSDESFLLLCGGTGAGKTIASLWALTQLRGVLVRSPDLGAVIDPWSSDRERGVKYMDPSEHALVVLDDLGVERASDDRWSVGFDELIDARVGHRNGRPLRTIISTNLTDVQIKERYSERARSRIRASSMRIPLTTKDMRSARPS